MASNGVKKKKWKWKSTSSLWILMIKAALCLPIWNYYSKSFLEFYFLFYFRCNVPLIFPRRKDPSPNTTSHAYIHLIWKFVVFISDIFPTISSLTSFHNTLALMNCLICRHTTSSPRAFTSTQSHKNSKLLVNSLFHMNISISSQTYKTFMYIDNSCVVYRKYFLLCDLHHFNTYFGTANLSVNLILHRIANTNVSLTFDDCLDPKTMFSGFRALFFFLGFFGFSFLENQICEMKKKK